MLLALKRLLDIEKDLKKMSDSSIILGYHLALKVNLDIKGFILVEHETKQLATALNQLKDNENIRFEVITEVERGTDELYKYLFPYNEDTKKYNSKIDLSFRRRFNNLLDYKKEETPLPCPIVTFYSYKGGVGRTTALAAFAAWYAIHHAKRVIILDCDFEAPGITNYFDLTEERLANLNGGVVEYLSDRQFVGEKLNLSKYLIETSTDYSKNGKIYVMPAGNLSRRWVSSDDPNLETHQNHYLQALSRLDLTNKEHIITQFRELLTDLQQDINPDIILIDSRTGFNDVIANIGLALSSLVIGFFGNNAQTIDGLYFFLDKINEGEIPTILVNAIINKGKFFKEFEENIKFYREQNSDKDAIVINNYSIFRDERLEEIGTKNEDKSEFINIVNNVFPFSSYQVLFDAINKYLNNLKENDIELSTPKGIDNPTESAQDIDISLQIDTKKKEVIEVKRRLLEHTRSYLPQLYGEEIAMNEFWQKQFYFRDCMKDIFNRDKFLVLGGKGTGKTTLYIAFREKPFVEELQKMAGIDKKNYEFINIISLKNERNANKLLEITQFKVDDIANVGSDYFFTRFWLIYVWNAILIDGIMDFKSALKIEPITNDVTTKNRFLEYIYSDSKYSMIEQELKEIDSLLRNQRKILIIAFDQLDYIVKPNRWSEGIAPLLNFWRSNPYTQIWPKLFVRTDLYNKLGNLTNKEQLTTGQAIRVEWSQDEIFSFFFKFIFSHSKDDFYFIMKTYQDYPDELIEQIQAISAKNNQIPLERRYLQPAVDTFFGKWAGKTTKYGESYDWFYRNLQNADNTISLRPFLDLIRGAIGNYFENRSSKNQDIKPILNASYFTYWKIRATAVERHFKDLADEEGNEDLNKVFEYIRSHLLQSQKKDFFGINEFDTLLREIISYYNNDIDNQTPDKLKELLIINGIVSLNKRPGGNWFYSFALIYKYYLGLHGKNVTTYLVR